MENLLECSHEYVECGRAVIGGVLFVGYKCAKCGHELADEKLEGGEISEKREVRVLQQQVGYKESVRIKR